MDSDRDYRSGPVPLPGFGASDQAGSAGSQAPDRTAGIRHVRRVSNWTAAALIVGAGGATVALAHQVLPTTAPATGMTSAGTAAVGHAATGPQASHSVATTSASGVTVTTTTRTVNGKTVVTHVRHAPAYHDN